MNKEQLLEKLNELNFPVGDYYLLSSGCLMLYGMREIIQDIDLCISEQLFSLIKDRYGLTDIKKNEYGFYKVNDWLEVIVNEKDTLKYDMKENIPVEELTTILDFKIKRNADKDKEDIANIKKYIYENKIKQE